MKTDIYISRNSFYHAIDGRVKILFTLSFSFVLFFLKGYFLPFIALSLVLVLLFSSVGIKEAWTNIKRILPVIVLILILSPFEKRGGEDLLKLGNIKIVTKEGFYSSYIIALRLFSLSLILNLYLLTERPREIIKNLRFFRLSYNASLFISIVLRAISHFIFLFAEIRDAMSLRLKEGKRGYPLIPTLASLTSAMLSSVKETADNLAERGYGRKGGDFEEEWEPFERKKDFLLFILPLFLFTLEIMI